MKKERILNNSLNIIRKYLKENAPTMSLASGEIAGTSEYKNEEGKSPPVFLPKKKKPLFRRGPSVQQKYTS
jgi:hypothetical protein